jgi:hypothetical protein
MGALRMKVIAAVHGGVDWLLPKYYADQNIGAL